MYDIKTTAKVPKGGLKPEMLVRFTDRGDEEAESIGLVVEVTRKWVHVLWIINANPGVCYNQNNDHGEYAIKDTDSIGKHHFITLESRRDLEPAPAGTEVTIKQIVK
jgi:hypothetical protein